MAVLTDFFVGDAQAIEKMDLLRGPAGLFPCVQSKRVDPVKLMTLQCIVEGLHLQDVLSSSDYQPIRDAGTEGPWIMKVPDSLSNALAGATPAQLENYGIAWAVTEEWKIDRGSPEELLFLLKHLSGLAGEAMKQRMDLLVWISL